MTRGKKSLEFSSSEPLYAVWRTMLSRCENPKHNRYHRYGGRGIRVCEEWHGYVVFRDWATSHGYCKGLQIDRINTDGYYSPSNCRFTTSKVQQQNRGNNRLVTALGVTKPLAAWADDHRCAVPYKLLWERLQDGWSFEDALITPQRRKGGYRLIDAWGESKSVTEWLSDSRCRAGSVRNLWSRINRGWIPERALSTPNKERGVI